VTDHVQQLSYILDKKGKLITPIPIDSDVVEILPEENESLKAFYSFEKGITIKNIP
jgi:hypothetical protein